MYTAQMASAGFRSRGLDQASCNTAHDDGTNCVLDIPFGVSVSSDGMCRLTDTQIFKVLNTE